MATVNWSLQHYTDTAANLTASNPTLLAGQLGIETDNLTTTPKFKIGDGVTAWSSLPYFYGGSLSAQDLDNVLSVGNTTNNQSIKFGTGNSYFGATNQTHIQYTTGLELHNTTANTDCLLSDTGLWKVNATQYMPNLTASRLLSLDANKNVINETGTGFLKLTAGVISYDTNTYLTTSAAALAYQPLDADLTSWAGVTRATGFDTFTATPSSANLYSLLTDKTGSGALVFGTSPTFTTDITTPLIIGGTAVGSAIQYKGTSGNGTSTVAAHEFLVGNNGATTAASIYNSGQVNIGNYASPTNLRALTIGQDTAYMSFGSLVGFTSFWAIYGNQATPSINNYALTGDSSTSTLNATALVNIAINNTTRASFRGVASSGVSTPFSFSVPANTGQTASTEIPNFKVTGESKTWANGGGATTIAIQRWNWFTANTAATSGGGSLTITDSFNLYSEVAVSSGVTITNNWGIGTTGGIKVNATANTVLGNAALATNATTGFLHVPSCAGTPTGTPTLYTGMIPVCADSTNNKLYIYSGGAWVALN